MAGVALHWFNRQSRRVRTALLAEQLRPYQIERLMQQLIEAYMRALGETDAQRQAQIWALQAGAEEQLAIQFKAFAHAFAQLPPLQTRTLRVALPGLEKLWPALSFDARRMMLVHADGIERVVANAAARAPRERAYTLMAELLLMQHSCHWFCRSQTIASARMLAQHKTHHAQALQAVSAATREAYLAVLRGPALG